MEICKDQFEPHESQGSVGILNFIIGIGDLTRVIPPGTQLIISGIGHGENPPSLVRCSREMNIKDKNRVTICAFSGKAEFRSVTCQIRVV
jgi:hypothetical protein